MTFGTTVQTIKSLTQDSGDVEEEEEFEDNDSIRKMMFPDEESEEGFDVNDFLTEINFTKQFEMTPAYLIYHPKRQITTVGNLTIHHDKFGGNEDPYIWHDQFLHTYCHITQLRNEKNQINFWVSGNTYPNFTQLFCDCVFTIAEKKIWTNNNFIHRKDPIVDNQQTFEHHYQWANKGHHRFARRKRYTLKADSDKSFQPQDDNGNLIDILPFLNKKGILTSKLIAAMTSKKGSRPMPLDSDLGQKLYDYLFTTAPTKLFGQQLKSIHPNWGQSSNQKVSSKCCYTHLS